MWGFKNSKNAETVHYRAIRYFLGVHAFTPTEGMYGAMGWATPQMRHHVNMIRFWNRIVNMDDARLTKKVFILDWMLCKANWSSKVLTVLKTVSSENVLRRRVQCDIKGIESRLVNNMMLNWEREIQQKPKLRTYIIIKCVFGPEEYLKLPCISRSEKSLLAQLRLGTLTLRIETGRLRAEDGITAVCILYNVCIRK